MALPVRRRLRGSKSGALGRVGAALAIVPLSLVGLGVLYVINNRPPRITSPVRMVPTVNAYPECVAAARIASRNRALEPSNILMRQQTALTDTQYATFEQSVTPAIARMRAALALPCAYPPIRAYTDIRWQDHLALRDLTRAIASLGLRRAQRGRMDQALDLWLDGLLMTVRFPRSGGMSPHFGARAASLLLIGKIDSFANDLSAKQLRHVADRLRAIQAERETLSQVIRQSGWDQERCSISLLADPKGLGSWTAIENRLISDVMQSSRAYPTKAPKLTVGDRLKGANFVMANKQALLRENLEYYEKLARELERAPYVLPAVKPPQNLLVFEQKYAIEMLYRNEAAWSVLMTGIALNQYRADHGRYPADLSALSPSYLPLPPADPFHDGRPLCYVAVADGSYAIAYSIGPDRKDDGGKIPTQSYLVSGYDIVAGSILPGARDAFSRFAGRMGGP